LQFGAQVQRRRDTTLGAKGQLQIVAFKSRFERGDGRGWGEVTEEGRLFQLARD